MSRWVWAPAVLVLLVAIGASVRFLTTDRELVAGTPSPRPVFQISLLELPIGEKLCIRGVTIPEDARRLRFQIGTFGTPGPPLDVTLSADGYVERLKVPAGYADSATVTAGMEPPAAARVGQVCIGRRGKARIAVVATEEERTLSRPEGRIGRRVTGADAYLAFYEGRSASALSQVDTIFERMSAFRPGIVNDWLLWPLLAVIVIGVPAGVLWAIVRAIGP